MIEQNKTKCKICNIVKTRIEAGLYPDSRNKRYLGEDGKHWSGLVCSQCHEQRMKDRMKNLRFKRQLEKK